METLELIEKPIIIKSRANYSRIDCINYLMRFYKEFKYYLDELDLIRTFDKIADMNAIELQVNVSILTVLANKSALVDSLDYYIKIIKQ